jgi:hypothetical protein
MKIKSHIDGNAYEVVAAGICLVVTDGDQQPTTILLYMRHGDVPIQKDDVNFPCGGLNPDESIYRGAARELYEECMSLEHRESITQKLFVGAIRDALVAAKAPVFIGKEPIDNNVVGMVGLRVSRKSKLYRNYISKLAESDRLEDYTSDSGANEGIPRWVEVSYDWEWQLFNSRYGIYNKAFVHWMQFNNRRTYEYLNAIRTSCLPHFDLGQTSEVTRPFYEPKKKFVQRWSILSKAEDPTFNRGEPTALGGYVCPLWMMPGNTPKFPDTEKEMK